MPIKIDDRPVPRHVALLGLGPSLEAYVDVAKRMGARRAFADEVWGINAVADIVHCDRVFHMDDVRIQQIRADARPETNIAAMLTWLKTHPGPVYTSVPPVGDAYPGLVAFPLQAVMNELGGVGYFNSTAAYAVALAVAIGVERITLFGFDFTYANSHHAEQGRACVEYYLGIARARGIEIGLPDSTSLMDGCTSRGARYYGYDLVEVNAEYDDAGAVALTFTDRPTLPTADEIEAAYDHTKHPNALVRAEAQAAAASGSGA
jgi:hypothetical protein